MWRMNGLRKEPDLANEFSAFHVRTIKNTVTAMQGFLTVYRNLIFNDEYRMILSTSTMYMDEFWFFKFSLLSFFNMGRNNNNACSTDKVYPV